MFKLLSPGKLAGGVILALPLAALLSANSATIIEGFESVSKGSYAVADV